MPALVRRTGIVAAIVVALLWVPQLAMASFSGSASAGLGLTTASLVAPTSVTGSYRCLTSGRTEGVEVTVSSFTDAGPTGSTYVFSILRGTTVLATRSQTAKAITLSSGYSSTDNKTTTYTLTIQATLKGWTGPSYSTGVSC